MCQKMAVSGNYFYEKIKKSKILLDITKKMCYNMVESGR